MEANLTAYVALQTLAVAGLLGLLLFRLAASPPKAGAAANVLRGIRKVAMQLCDMLGPFAGHARWALLPAPQEDTQLYHVENHRHLTQMHERHGDIFLAKRGGKPVLFVRSPTAVRTVLQGKAFGKLWQSDDDGAKRSTVAQYVHNLVQPLLMDPVFSNKGSQNMDARTMLNPVTTGSRAFKKGFAAEIDSALSSWKPGQPADVLALAHDLIRSALYHAIAGSKTEGLHTITPAFHEALAHFVARYEQPGHDPSVTALDERMMEQLQNSAVGVVAGFRRLHEAEKAKASEATAATEATGEAEEAAGPEQRALLAVMLEAGCSDEACAAVLVNVVIAGAEAPASALAHTLQELAFNPGVQSKVRGEVCETVGPAGSPVVDLLEKLPYTKGAVLEGLRMFAPATLVKRQALEDTEVEGCRVPKGTVVELCVTAIHFDEKQFANPTDFDPTRPGPTAAAILGRERCFMPFSGGLRGCPGRQLAVTMLHTALASIVQRFELLPASPDAKKAPFPNTVRKFVEWPANGIPIRLAPVAAPARDASGSRMAQGPLAAAPGMAPPSRWHKNVQCDVGGGRDVDNLASSREELPRIPMAMSREALPRIPFSNSRDGNLPRIPMSNSRDGNLPCVPMSNSRDGNVFERAAR